MRWSQTPETVNNNQTQYVQKVHNNVGLCLLWYCTYNSMYALTEVEVVPYGLQPIVFLLHCVLGSWSWYMLFET